MKGQCTIAYYTFQIFSSLFLDASGIFVVGLVQIAECFSSILWDGRSTLFVIAELHYKLQQGISELGKCIVTVTFGPLKLSQIPTIQGGCTLLVKFV